MLDNSQQNDNLEALVMDFEEVSPSGIEKSSFYLKPKGNEHGNEYFNNGYYLNAIEYYTRAISFNS